MNVLFLTLVKIKSLEERGLYHDLLRKFRDEGHQVYVVTPAERREKVRTHLSIISDINILHVRTFNMRNTNILEKGAGTLAIEYQYLRAIKKHFSNIKFDLILYSTPPITFTKVIDFIKAKDNAYSYLLLKDIFPQNAIDMKMLKKGGVLHRMFLKKEAKLYQSSEMIGCMSLANIDYIIKHNPNINSNKIEVNPNSINPVFTFQSPENRQKFRLKYELPLNKKIFVYGGNLGIPQGVDFLLETIASNKNPKVFFLIIGSGTEYNSIKNWFELNRPQNALLLEGLPKNEYDELLKVCDVGLIFLHKDFTIPNFPSRLLSYLEMKMPVIAATDSNTDIGKVIEEANCGYWVLAGDINKMEKTIERICANNDEFLQMKENAWKLLIENYTVDHTYQLIKEKIKNV